MNDIATAIDELSNLKSLSQISKENAKARQDSLEMTKRAKIAEQRLQQASIRMKKIEKDEKDRCKKTAALLKDFENESANGPFFDSLLHILLNFQGTHFFSFFLQY